MNTPDSLEDYLSDSSRASIDQDDPWSPTNGDNQDLSFQHNTIRSVPENINSSDSGYQDISFDPKIVVSDHEGDDEPSKVGYNDYDTDDDTGSMDIDGDQGRFPRIELDVSAWCTCNQCITMDSEIECYCCRESSLVSDSVLKETNEECVIKVGLFVKTIEDAEILELQANGQSGISRDKTGKITSEGLRYTAYVTFLQICSLRFCGKGRRYALPSCVVKRIRELYPSPDGQYTEFQPGLINSRI